MAVNHFRVHKGWVPSSPKLLEEAERRLLARVKNPYELRMVPIQEYVPSESTLPRQPLFINTIAVHAAKDNGTSAQKNKPTLVIIHGWGAGIGLFCKNFDGLSEHFNVYAIDLLGWGRSSRPRFDTETGIHAQSWWVDSLEAWRVAMGLDNFVLLGHSFGGFVATSYALKHQRHLQRLILASPFGLSPFKVIYRSQALFMAALRRRIWSLTPQGLVRALGPFGPGTVAWARRHMQAWFEQSSDAVDYLYHTSVAGGGSGEKAFARMMSVDDGWTVPLSAHLHELRIPTTLLYGQRDWVDMQHGASIRPLIRAPCMTVVVPNSGHHAYAEDTKSWNDAVIRAIPRHL
eukprot:GILJ01011944.1.p1 GENE.GILJ01011944.1~~GILJ01011944.1.p1  ORF type:complete len:373 (+),score=22.58 GILJ01011944.1:84-1121(+)